MLFRDSRSLYVFNSMQKYHAQLETRLYSSVPNMVSFKLDTTRQHLTVFGVSDLGAFKVDCSERSQCQMTAPACVSRRYLPR